MKTQSAALLSLLLAGCSGGDLAEPSPDELGVSADSLGIGNGIAIDNGLNLPNGTQLPNGTVVSNGINLGNGIALFNGIDLQATATLGGVTGPYYAPPAGSDLEKWIDVQPTMRQRIIKDLIECALPGGVAVRVRYRGVTSTYSGIAGLGPGIRTGIMTVAEQEKVSACLLARVNARGVVINVALFGPMPGFNSTTATEISTYSHGEAAFWGNLFLPVPQAYMCSDDGLVLNKCENRACLRSDGSCDCGLVIYPEPQLFSGHLYTPRCAPTRTTFSIFTAPGVCGVLTPLPGSDYGQYYAACKGGSRSWDYAVTTRTHVLPFGSACKVGYDCESLTCVAGTCS